MSPPNDLPSVDGDTLVASDDGSSPLTNPEKNPDLCLDCRQVLREFTYNPEEGTPHTRNITIKGKLLDDTAATECRLCDMLIASMIWSAEDTEIPMRSRPSKFEPKADYYCFYKGGDHNIVLVYNWATINATHLDKSSTSSLKLSHAGGEARITLSCSLVDLIQYQKFHRQTYTHMDQ
jgi:hypothetical protein